MQSIAALHVYISILFVDRKKCARDMSVRRALLRLILYCQCEETSAFKDN